MRHSKLIKAMKAEWALRAEDICELRFKFWDKKESGNLFGQRLLERKIEKLSKLNWELDELIMIAIAERAEWTAENLRKFINR